MGDTTSPSNKSEMTQSLAAQTHIFPSVPSPMSNDNLMSVKPRRRGSQSPNSGGAIEAQGQQDKAKKSRTTPYRNAGGRGSVMTMPPLMPGEEITYTPTTHRISKAKKGKKVHNCTFPGCPKVCCGIDMVEFAANEDMADLHSS